MSYIHWWFNGFDAQKAAFCVHLTRILLPAQLFFFAGGVFGAVLLVRKQFRAARRVSAGDRLAYVDDCLSRADRAAVEDRMLEDPDLRKQIEGWLAQNEAIRTAFADPSAWSDATAGWGRAARSRFAEPEPPLAGPLPAGEAAGLAGEGRRNPAALRGEVRPPRRRPAARSRRGWPCSARSPRRSPPASASRRCFRTATAPPSRARRPRPIAASGRAG